MFHQRRAFRLPSTEGHIEDGNTLLHPTAATQFQNEHAIHDCCVVQDWMSTQTDVRSTAHREHLTSTIPTISSVRRKNNARNIGRPPCDKF